jgi:drug/metabolite transporter (DMT)-like permease
LIAIGLIWGYNWVVMKIALAYIGPLDFAFLRVAFGTLLLFLVLLGMRAPLAPRHVVKTALLGLFQTAGFVGLISMALVLGETGKSAVLSYTMPFWVILLGWPFLGERLRGAQWPAVALALVGLVLVLEIWNGGAGLVGSLLALGAGALWGVSVIIAKKIPVDGTKELLSMTAWQMLFALIPLAALALVVPERSIDWTPTFVAALVYNGVGGMALASLLWLYILQRLPAVLSGMSSLVVPVVGIVAAWVQLGERPGIAAAVGMVLILTGLGVLLLGGAKVSPSVT